MTDVQKGPAPESRFPAASPTTEKVVPREGGATSAAVPEAELPRIARAYEDCLKERMGAGRQERR